MKKSRSGFTLIEILVTVAIFIVLAGIVLINITGRRTKTDLIDTTAQIGALLRQAQSDSMAQKNGLSWGVHFDNTATTSPFYALFSGSSYSTGMLAARYPLPADVAFSASSILPGSSTDVVFNQITGMPTNGTSTSITLYLVSQYQSTGPLAGTITRQSSGKVFFDNFTRATL